jgi:hypothetical protein
LIYSAAHRIFAVRSIKVPPGISIDLILPGSRKKHKEKPKTSVLLQEQALVI